jgi:hypothetical protein
LQCPKQTGKYFDFSKENEMKSTKALLAAAGSAALLAFAPVAFSQ